MAVAWEATSRYRPVSTRGAVQQSVQQIGCDNDRRAKTKACKAAGKCGSTLRNCLVKTNTQVQLSEETDGTGYGVGFCDAECKPQITGHASPQLPETFWVAPNNGCFSTPETSSNQIWKDAQVCPPAVCCPTALQHWSHGLHGSTTWTSPNSIHVSASSSAHISDLLGSSAISAKTAWMRCPVQQMAGCTTP
jgi:hypothetical protein